MPQTHDTPPDRPFVVGVELNGAGSHPAAWRTRPGGDFVAPARIRDVARLADDAGFTFATFGADDTHDPVPGRGGRLDAIEVASFAAAFTRHIGLLAEASAIHAEPFHLANQLASLDFAARGRAGWIVDPFDSPQRARSYGVDEVTNVARRRAEVGEVISAIRRLWDTWEAGVFIADAATGRFLDPDRLHYADFEGEFFSVKGPSITPRPPQGHLPTLTLGTEIGPALADAALISTGSPASLRPDVRAARAELGTPQPVLVEIDVLLGADDAAAADRAAALDRDAAWDSPRLRYVGGPDGLISLLREIEPEADGVRLFGAVVDVDVPAIAHAVLPALRDSGLITTPAATLRATLGLPEADNSFTHPTRRSLVSAAPTEGASR